MKARLIVSGFTAATILVILAAGGCETSGGGDDDSGDGQTVDVSGSWRGEDTGGLGGASGTLAQSGNSVSGSCVYDTGERGTFSGSVDGNVLTGTLDAGYDVFPIEATVSGNTMSGSWGDGGFTATRR
jgi:hypothetical protein